MVQSGSALSVLFRQGLPFARTVTFAGLRVPPQCKEVFRALEQKAVFKPMAVIFIYNLFQVTRGGGFCCTYGQRRDNPNTPIGIDTTKDTSCFHSTPLHISEDPWDS